MTRWKVSCHRNTRPESNRMAGLILNKIMFTNTKQLTIHMIGKLSSYVFRQLHGNQKQNRNFKDMTRWKISCHRNAWPEKYMLKCFTLNKIMFMYTKQLTTHMMVNYHNMYLCSSMAIKNKLEIPTIWLGE
jgi:hypothetical protein